MGTKTAKEYAELLIKLHCLNNFTIKNILKCKSFAVITVKELLHEHSILETIFISESDKRTSFLIDVLEEIESFKITE